MKRLVSSLPLSALLFVVWLLLNQSVSPGTLLMGAVLAVLVPLGTKSLRPGSVTMRKPLVAFKLWAIVMRDFVRSNIRVATLILTRRPRDIPSGFLQVPLDMRDPHALALLAMILCLTPGTAWAEVSRDRSMLLLHVFEIVDADAMVAMIKQRYERPLMEIFE
ncbi:MAG: Na+/H+ antiporter subunit E [Burkholderiaceae bacterium]|nr:Na+/H+ antiporter subunit E [Xylophilus sp.]MBP7420334.1 Na+/H+ antiporter subunit E [Burkholderiaceae bacterium]